MAQLVEGAQAPDFTAESTVGTLTLSALLAEAREGVVVYFYPKASTPGCTTEACDFRDSLNSLKGAGYTVVGVSADPMPCRWQSGATAIGARASAKVDPPMVTGLKATWPTTRPSMLAMADNVSAPERRRPSTKSASPAAPKAATGRGCVKTSRDEFCRGTSPLARIEIVRCRPISADR